MNNGKWRSLVAHLLWEQGVAGSNPVFPTMVAVAQLAEHSDVARAVVGSSPIGYPKEVYASG